MNKLQVHLYNLHTQKLLPNEHIDYLKKLKKENLNPKIIYDIGACVLHWYREAVEVWPNSTYFVFDANKNCEFLYKKYKLSNHLGVLSKDDNEEVDFYLNDYYPGGCSYYRENKDINGPAERIYTDSHKIKMSTSKLDTIVSKNNWPLPNLMKLDVQGAELDIILGSSNCVQHCDDIILELQDLDFNIGAPKSKQVIDYMDSIGFDCLGFFSKNRFDMDFHFRKNYDKQNRSCINY